MNNPVFGNPRFDGPSSTRPPSSHTYPVQVTGRYPDQFGNVSNIGNPEGLPNDAGVIERVEFNEQPGMPYAPPGAGDVIGPQQHQPVLIRRFRCGACDADIQETEPCLPCHLGCKQIFHRACTHLTDDAWEQLTRHMRQEMPSATWICSRCSETGRIPLCIPISALCPPAPSVDMHRDPGQFRR